MNEQIKFIKDNPHFSYETLELKKHLTVLEQKIIQKEKELAEVKEDYDRFCEGGIVPKESKNKQIKNYAIPSNYRIIQLSNKMFRIEKKLPILRLWYDLGYNDYKDYDRCVQILEEHINPH